MAWLELTLETFSVGAEAAAAALTARGFSDLVIEDQQEFEDFLDENRACWDYIDEELQKKLQGLSRIKLYLDDADTEALSRLQAYAAEAGLPMTMTAMAETDWSESWKDSYPPQEIGENLVVLPYWLAGEYTGTRLPVILDPGLTFGTGAHPSTRMVMAEMERFAGRAGSGWQCLDLGSGSGILSLTALRLGAGQAVGVDIDPKAEDAARENADCNGFGKDRFTPMTGDVTKDRALMKALADRQWDLVLVNIVADVIIGLAPVLPAFLTPETTLILSGILDSRLEDVTRALRAAGIAVKNIRAEEDWRCVTAALR